MSQFLSGHSYVRYQHLEEEGKEEKVCLVRSSWIVFAFAHFSILDAPDSYGLLPQPNRFQSHLGGQQNRHMDALAAQLNVLSKKYKQLAEESKEVRWCVTYYVL